MKIIIFLVLVGCFLGISYAANYTRTGNNSFQETKTVSYDLNQEISHCNQVNAQLQALNAEYQRCSNLISTINSMPIQNGT